jgi:hypothetical protein
LILQKLQRPLKRKHRSRQANIAKILAPNSGQHPRNCRRARSESSPPGMCSWR